ncbi:magnesium transporter CorA family protein [Paenibacillus protaetiae]|uniref:Magnesium transporter n=1 Tax=Paenibacillus protaetiae TaxID=2509456 RepID=A0A4P6EXE8_9BACL|nr:magnesium transporter CorA family protein [Paenibacillus protaetiae]QAY66903.1 magnesium transporter [Paenibacillus protaetiae]
MIHRVLQFGAGWEWHMLQPQLHIDLNGPLPKRTSREPAAASTVSDLLEQRREQFEAMNAVKQLLPECAGWLDTCLGNTSNRITTARTPGIGPHVYGTVIFQISEEQDDLQPLHFWASEKQLVTVQTDLRLGIRMQGDEEKMSLEQSLSAPEALMAIFSAILQPFQDGLDGFEQRLGDLERSMRYRNRTSLIDIIFDRRYELLHWSHLFIPIREIHSAVKEAFMEQITGTEGYRRMTAKLDRIDLLLKHYTIEMDTLIAMDDAISSFRGNDIMKTLTIFTAIFTPATVVGALWGENFDFLPWTHERWGFAVSTAIVLLITIAIYFWLWRKGWTGDILYGKRRQAFRISAAAKRSRRRAVQVSAPDEPSAAISSETLDLPLSRSKRK